MAKDENKKFVKYNALAGNHLTSSAEGAHSGNYWIHFCCQLQCLAIFEVQRLCRERGT